MGILCTAGRRGRKTMEDLVLAAVLKRNRPARLAIPMASLGFMAPVMPSLTEREMSVLCTARKGEKKLFKIQFWFR